MQTDPAVTGGGGSPGVAELPILQVEHLTTCFRRGERVLRAVDDLSFTLNAGRTLGLAGESGCGKSVTALSILGLVPSPGYVAAGRIMLGGRDLLGLSAEELRRVRGSEVAMIFQEPMTSLNPVFTVGYQIAESYLVHRGISGPAAREEAVALLARVGIPDAGRRFDEYPHQMSGGMRQRAMIAMALAGNPRVLIADEPTTALDVTIQAQILDLIDRLRRESGMGTLFITHDLGVLGRLADDLGVMYAGRIVELGRTGEIFDAPWHPYTTGLLASRPARWGATAGRRLPVIPGTVPDLADLPPGCHFYPRCPRRADLCARETPLLEEKMPGRMVRCWVAP